MFTKLIRKFSSNLPYNNINLIRSHSLNIRENLSLEAFIFRHSDLIKQPTLLLWRNDRAIVIGKHQNFHKECYMQRIEEDGVIIARRRSGGGAVYQDLGNSCFSFMTQIYDESALPLDIKEVNNKIVLQALKKKFGIKGEASGRNDLVINGKKFSGSAYQVDLGGKKALKKTLHHGTLLLDIQLQDVWRYLNPNKAKLKSKGIDSVISRVRNLKEIVPDISHEAICDAIAEEFKNEYASITPNVNSLEIQSPLDFDPKVREIYNDISQDDWLFGETPKFTNNLETRFNWGIMDIFFQVEKGKNLFVLF